MIYSKRFLWHHGPYFNYRMKWESYKNPNDGDRYWESEETWYVGLQLASKLFESKENVYYDGQTVTYCTILGIRFIKGYSWQAERIL